jgi:hypothetical protein
MIYRLILHYRNIQKKQLTSINTNERMIMSVYLGLSDQTLVERHNRVYGNMKIIK